MSFERAYFELLEKQKNSVIGHSELELCSFKYLCCYCSVFTGAGVGLVSTTTLAMESTLPRVWPLSETHSIAVTVLKQLYSLPLFSLSLFLSLCVLV